MILGAISVIANPVIVAKEKETNNRNLNLNSKSCSNLNKINEIENYQNENGEIIPPFLMVISLADMKFEYIEPLSLGTNFNQYSPYEKLEKGSKRNIESMKRRISYNSVDLDPNNNILLTSKIAAINNINALNNHMFSNLNSSINSRESTFGNFENFYENVASAEKIFRPEILPLSTITTNCEKDGVEGTEIDLTDLVKSPLFPEDVSQNIFFFLFFLFLFCLLFSFLLFSFFFLSFFLTFLSFILFSVSVIFPEI